MVYIVAEESLATDRVLELAYHHGWTAEQTVWRIFNALVNQSKETGDLATLIWGIDFVAREEGEKPMFDATLPADREADQLYDMGQRRINEPEPDGSFARRALAIRQDNEQSRD